MSDFALVYAQLIRKVLIAFSRKLVYTLIQ